MMCSGSRRPTRASALLSYCLPRFAAAVFIKTALPLLMLLWISHEIRRPMIAATKLNPVFCLLSKSLLSSPQLFLEI